MIRLVPIDAVRASDYNPRKNDEKRLALAELSIRKLGFLLPIYADESGEILSGHQRHLVATRMGFTEIPVEYVKAKDLQERKVVNILFNRATNDLQKQDTCEIIKKRLYSADVEELGSELPDIEPNSPESFPCVNALHGPTKPPAKALERSIPDYKSMRALVYKAGERFIRPDTLVVDVGCSTGLAVEPFVEKYRDQNDFLLIDSAYAMVEASRKRFRDEPSVIVKPGYLWDHLPLEDPASLVLSVLSLQFMPTSYRQKMISDIYDGLVPGGALILVEKIVSENLDELMVQMYYEMKRENGYTEEQIMEKRRSLENVLSPLKPEWNVDMLRTAGFREVGMFWRCLNFCGWIAVK